MVDLKALRYFEFVAELKSFSKAAVRLRVAQPALSRQIKKLEDELGVSLVRRHGRGIEVTESGLLLLQRARVLSQDVSAMVQDVRAGGNGLHGTITVGVPPTVGDLLIPPLFMRLKRDYPNLQLVVVESASPDLYERLLNKELTVGVLHNPEHHAELQVVPLLKDDLYVIGPPREINGLKPVVPNQSIDGLPMILPRSPHNRRLLIDRFCMENDIKLNVTVNVDGFTIIKAMVEKGLGYSILSHYGVHEAIRGGHLSGVKVMRPAMSWELCIAHRRDLRDPRPVNLVIENMRRDIQPLISPDMLWPTATYVPPSR